MNVKVLVLYEKKYQHGKQKTRRTREKKALSEIWYIPGTYIILRKNEKQNHSTWLKRFDEGIKLNKLRKRALKERDTHTEADTASQRKDARHERDTYRLS